MDWVALLDALFVNLMYFGAALWLLGFLFFEVGRWLERRNRSRDA